MRTSQSMSLSSYLIFKGLLSSCMRTKGNPTPSMIHQSTSQGGKLVSHDSHVQHVTSTESLTMKQTVSPWETELSKPSLLGGHSGPTTTYVDSSRKENSSHIVAVAGIAQEARVIDQVHEDVQTLLSHPHVGKIGAAFMRREALRGGAQALVFVRHVHKHQCGVLSTPRT